MVNAEGRRELKGSVADISAVKENPNEGISEAFDLGGISPGSYFFIHRYLRDYYTLIKHRDGW